MCTWVLRHEVDTEPCGGYGYGRCMRVRVYGYVYGALRLITSENNDAYGNNDACGYIDACGIIYGNHA